MRVLRPVTILQNACTRELRRHKALPQRTRRNTEGHGKCERQCVVNRRNAAAWPASPPDLTTHLRVCANSACSAANLGKPLEVRNREFRRDRKHEAGGRNQSEHPEARLFSTVLNRPDSAGRLLIDV